LFHQQDEYNNDKNNDDDATREEEATPLSTIGIVDISHLAAATNGIQLRTPGRSSID
jgi:hypothetical protein